MAKPKKSIEELRETGRKRAEKFHKKQEEAKRKQVSGFISEQAYDALCRIRDKTGQSAGQIFENFLLDNINVNMDKTVNIDVNINADKKGLISPVKVEPREKPEIESVPDREYLKERIYKLKTEQDLGWKPIAHLLNNEGMPTLSGKGKWSDRSVKRLFEEKEKELTI